MNLLVKEKHIVRRAGENKSKLGQSIPKIIKGKGIFCYCTCGHEVVYYSDSGIRCSKCGKLYGTLKVK